MSSRVSCHPNVSRRSRNPKVPNTLVTFSGGFTFRPSDFSPQVWTARLLAPPARPLSPVLLRSPPVRDRTAAIIPAHPLPMAAAIRSVPPPRKTAHLERQMLSTFRRWPETVSRTIVQTSPGLSFPAVWFYLEPQHEAQFVSRDTVQRKQGSCLSVRANNNIKAKGTNECPGDTTHGCGQMPGQEDRKVDSISV